MEVPLYLNTLINATRRKVWKNKKIVYHLVLNPDESKKNEHDR